jgi:hypothetical protein
LRGAWCCDVCHVLERHRAQFLHSYQGEQGHTPLAFPARRWLEILTLSSAGVLSTLTLADQYPIRSAVLPQLTQSAKDITT